MACQHPVHQVLQLICRVAGVRVADDDLHNLLRQVHLARQRPLLQRHMQQRAHLAYDHRRKRAFQRNPHAADALVNLQGGIAVAGGQEARFLLFQRQLMPLPNQRRFTRLHREPNPLVMRLNGASPCLKHRRACCVNPRTAGAGQAARLVVSFHHHSIRRSLYVCEQVRLHALHPPSTKWHNCHYGYYNAQIG